MMNSVPSFFRPAAKKCKHSIDSHCRVGEAVREILPRKKPSVTHLETSASFDCGDQIRKSVAQSSKGEASDLKTLRPNSSDSGGSAHLEKSAESLRQEKVGEQSFLAASGQSNCDPSSLHPLFKSVSELGRQWCSFHRWCYNRERSRNFYFSVVSYNILAEGLLQSHNELYAGADDWVKNWDYRKRNLLQELLFYGADILCLQEVEEEHFQHWFEPKLREKGYVGVYKKRTGNKVDGCATFYKESKFTLVKTKLVSFNVPGIKLMNRDNVAVLALLKPKAVIRERRSPSSSDTYLCIANTHLLFNTKRGDIKLAQLAYLFAEIDEIARISPSGDENPFYHPIVFCGDFNSTPFSPIYEFVARGLLDYKGMHRDNLSGQNGFRQDFPSWQAASCNLIPWELGITTSSCKRNNVQAKGNLGKSYAKEWKDEWSPKLSSGNSTSSCNHSHSESCSGLQPTDCKLSITPKSSNETKEQEAIHCNSQPSVLLAEKEAFNASTIQYHKLNFNSTYKYFIRKQPGQQEVTTFHERVCTVVDYIFYSPGGQWNCSRCKTNHGLLQPTGILRLLTEEQVWVMEGLPNRFLSSDHLSLVASFVLRL